MVKEAGRGASPPDATITWRIPIRPKQCSSPAFDRIRLTHKDLMARISVGSSGSVAGRQAARVRDIGIIEAPEEPDVEAEEKIDESHPFDTYQCTVYGTHPKYLMNRVVRVAEHCYAAAEPVWKE